MHGAKGKRYKMYYEKNLFLALYSCLLLSHTLLKMADVSSSDFFQPVRQENGAVIALSSAKFNVQLIATHKTEIVTAEN